MAVSRKARLESLLHQEIAICVQQELRDPRLGFITVTRVSMTDDLQTVTAYWSVLGEAKHRNLAAQALERARTFVQRQYSKVVKTRLIPILSFAYDEQQVRRSDLDDLIRKARSTDTDHGATPEPPAPAPTP